MAPVFLLIETSCRAGFVALATGEEVRRVGRLDESRKHARDLAPLTAQILEEENLRPGEVDAVLVSIGPGSYTGLRVGVMSAKTFAYATGAHLIGIETMDVIAQQAPPDFQLLDVIVDAQQDRIYVQRYRREGDRWRQDTELAIRYFTDWLNNRPMEAGISGPGLERFANRLPNKTKVVAKELWFPQPESFLRVGWQNFAAGKRDDLWTLEPLYLRPSAAEEKFQQQ